MADRSSSNGVDRVRNYFIEPDVEELIERLISGEYVVLHGARQTGKTSMVLCALEYLGSMCYNCVYVDFPAQCSTLSSLDDFWKLITQRVYESSDGELATPDLSGFDSEAYFRRLLAKDGRKDKDTILVFDEANHFSRMPNAYKNSFLNNLRHLKQIGKSRLLSLMLVGTASLLDDLRIPSRYRRHLGSSGNVYSPFSNDALYRSKNFTQEEVWQLISQFAADQKVKVDRDVSDIIWTSTAGHKGLVGVCCGLLSGGKTMRDFGHRDAGMWSTFAKMHLLENVFARPTYNAMLEYCYALQGDERKLLLKMLQNGGTLELEWGQHLPLLATVEFLVAEGIVVDTSDTDGFSTLEISSELLHSLLLKQLCVEEEDLPVETGPLPFNRLWIIQRTIGLLSFDVLLQQEPTSEYRLQFEFFIKLKKVLKLAYPYLKWKVIPEAKHEENGRRRLDILAKDGDKAWFGFEFLRQGSMEKLIEHYNRALWYAEVHSCIVYMINFVLDGEGLEFKGEPGAPVIVYNVFVRGSEADMVGGFQAVKLQLSDISSKLGWAFEESALLRVPMRNPICSFRWRFS